MNPNNRKFYTNLFKFPSIKDSLNFKLKLIFHTNLLVSNIFFAYKNCSFCRFSREMARYLNMVQSCSYLKSSMICIQTLCAKSIFDDKITFINIIFGFSKIGPFFPFPSQEAPVSGDGQYKALKVPGCQKFLTSVQFQTLNFDLVVENQK